uniref:Uncharacterized protein n=1 Tax=Oryza brachyantha TaxID=4533 RepID=J3LP62_ORYBR
MLQGRRPERLPRRVGRRRVAPPRHGAVEAPPLRRREPGRRGGGGGGQLQLRRVVAHAADPWPRAGRPPERELLPELIRPHPLLGVDPLQDLLPRHRRLLAAAFLILLGFSALSSSSSI